MSNDKKVTKEKVVEAAPSIPKVDEKETLLKFQESLIARLEGFESKMESLQQENALLNKSLKTSLVKTLYLILAVLLARRLKPLMLSLPTVQDC
jgi:predicted nuclease with TOPRIM domain